MNEETIFQLFENGSRKFSNRPCVVYINEELSITLTYSEFSRHLETFYNSWMQSSSAGEFVAIVGNELTIAAVILINGYDVTFVLFQALLNVLIWLYYLFQNSEIE